MIKRVGKIGNLVIAVVVTLCLWVLVSRYSPLKQLERSLLQLEYTAQAAPEDYDHASAEAEALVRAAGTNAFPLLLSWIAREPRRATTLDKILASFRFGRTRTRLCRLSGHSCHAAAAVVAFRFLGTNALSVLPQLETAARRNSYASRALFYVGRPTDIAHHLDQQAGRTVGAQRN